MSHRICEECGPIRLELSCEAVNEFASVSTTRHGGMVAAKRRIARAFEREFIRRALNECFGSVTDAAEWAVMDRRNFHRLMRKHGLKSINFPEPTFTKHIPAQGGWREEG